VAILRCSPFSERPIYHVVGEFFRITSAYHSWFPTCPQYVCIYTYIYIHIYIYMYIYIHKI
jgi:hypothetical protein